jgi:4-amino-4-deoxy-L-arabinose transferase-like glycosyltransferase
MQALGMLALGVHYEPGQMLASAATGPEPWPEWAVRFPVFVFALLGTYVLYKAVARAFGRRAGLFAGLALTAMPQWFFVAHQTMTDLPFVAALAAAMGFAAMAITCDPSAEVARWEVQLLGRSLRLSAWHVVLGAVLALAVPQALYLLSRNVELLVSPLVIGARHDAFWQGSGLGNCGLPGNVDCKVYSPTLPRLYPALQALLWMQAIGLVLYLEWGERRRQRLLFLAAWLCAALATMAKGPAGLVLPAAALLAWMVSARRLSDLSKLELTAGLLTVCAVALPWFLAMYARHGSGFVDRLLFHDMFKRAFSHVHDTNEGDDTSFRYYVWQLGYATFPLVGLVPAALAGLARARLTNARGHTLVLFGLWFVLSFCLFAFMGTKFHHYILPVVPAAAALVGVLLDELWRSAGPHAGATRDAPGHAPLGAVALAGAVLVLAVGRDLFAPRAGQPSQARLLHLFTYNYRRPWPASLDMSFELQVATLAAVACTLALAVPRARRVAVGATLGVALAFAAWGLDRYFVATSPHWGQRELVVAYHRASAEQPGPLVSYQQNWKGENFYTGNAVPAFVTSGLRFQDYVAEKRRRGANTVYFLVEHGRLTGLRGELSRPKELVALVPPEANNKFTLARATFE